MTIAIGNVSHANLIWSYLLTPTVIALFCVLCHRHHDQEHSPCPMYKDALVFEIFISAPYTLACSCLSSASVPLLISTANFTLERVEEVAKEAVVAKQAEVARVGF